MSCCRSGVVDYPRNQKKYIYLFTHRIKGFSQKKVRGYFNFFYLLKRTSAICRNCGKLVVEISRNSLRRFIDSNGAAHEI